MRIVLDWLRLCSGAWILASAWLNKNAMSLKKNVCFVGTPENPSLSVDALDSMDALMRKEPRLVRAREMDQQKFDATLVVGD